MCQIKSSYIFQINELGKLNYKLFKQIFPLNNHLNNKKNYQEKLTIYMMEMEINEISKKNSEEIESDNGNNTSATETKE